MNNRVHSGSGLHLLVVLGARPLSAAGWIGAPGDLQAPAASAADAAFDSTLFDGMRYRMIGPHRGGRVTAVAGIAENPLVYFMGSTGGGIWKDALYWTGTWTLRITSLNSGKPAARWATRRHGWPPH